jgi:SulP family sulfate permease
MALVVMLVLILFTGPLQFCGPGAIVFTIAVRLVDLKGLDDLRRESPREWILALVLSLCQHVRHSYQLAMAVETRTADGHWQMDSVEAGRTIVPGFLVSGLALTSSIRMSITSPRACADWR